jgi:hypothetical protein
LMYNGIYMIRAINAFLIIIKSTRGNNVTQR